MNFPTNRKQRRDALKNGITENDLKELTSKAKNKFNQGFEAGYEAGAKASINATVETMNFVAIYSAIEVMACDKQEVQDLLDTLKETFVGLNTGKITLDEIKKRISSILGIEI